MSIDESIECQFILIFYIRNETLRIVLFRQASEHRFLQNSYILGASDNHLHSLNLSKKNTISDPLIISGMHDGASRKIFENARKLRGKMTNEEKMLWDLLRKKLLGYRFRRQHPIYKYVLDFYCHEKRLSVELDGEYHILKDQKQRDIERTEYLNRVGIHEIRFSNEQIRKNLENVILSIKRELERA